MAAEASKREWVLVAVLVAMPAMATPALAADHRDGPIFPNTYLNGRRDLNDLYIFRSPNNSTNTVMIMTVAPFAGITTPLTFEDGKTRFELAIDNTGDHKEDLTFRITFGPPNELGAQVVTLIGLPKRAFPGGNVLATGNTNTNIPVGGGGLFRAGIFDDPFFFDAAAFTSLLNGGTFPRPPGQASNFFANVNTLGVVLEVPTVAIDDTGGVPDIGLIGRVLVGSKQVDRMGRPAINTALIPPVPRGSLFPNSGPELRNAFNKAKPSQDVDRFTEPMVDVLRNFYGRTAADAAGIADLLLPDVLTYSPNFAEGFPNGRRLRDDVIDIELGLLTGGAITTDNVADDNGTRITDGNGGTTAAFPYIGFRNSCPAGVPGGL